MIFPGASSSLAQSFRVEKRNVFCRLVLHGNVGGHQYPAVKTGNSRTQNRELPCLKQAISPCFAPFPPRPTPDSALIPLFVGRNPPIAGCKTRKAERNIGISRRQDRRSRRHMPIAGSCRWISGLASQFAGPDIFISRKKQPRPSASSGACRPFSARTPPNAHPTHGGRTPPGVWLPAKAVYLPSACAA